jgi:Tol biopolymer transport system component
VAGVSAAGRAIGGAVLSYYAPAQDNPYYDIFLYDPRTHILQNLTRHIANDSAFAWSRDGSRLAFISTRVWATPDLFVMDADGRNIQQVVTGYMPAQPDWSPDGAALTLVGVTTDGQPEVLAVDLATNAVTRLTETRNEREKMALWSPDGRYIAYMSEENPFVYVVTPDGAARKLVTLVYSEMPVWSPDGSYLAYVARQDSSLQLQAVDGAAQKILFNGSKPITTPVWSPDGKYLAFGVAHINQQSLRLVDVATGEYRAIIGFWNIDSPAWSPDGRTLAFFGTSVDDPQGRGIYTYDTLTRERRLLLKVARLNSLVWQPE